MGYGQFLSSNRIDETERVTPYICRSGTVEVALLVNGCLYWLGLDLTRVFLSFSPYCLQQLCWQSRGVIDCNTLCSSEHNCNNRCSTMQRFGQTRFCNPILFESEMDKSFWPFCWITVLLLHFLRLFLFEILAVGPEHGWHGRIESVCNKKQCKSLLALLEVPISVHVIQSLNYTIIIQLLVTYL